MKKSIGLGLLFVLSQNIAIANDSFDSFKGWYGGTGLSHYSTLGRRTTDSIKVNFPGAVSEVGRQIENTGLKKNSFGSQTFLGIGSHLDKFYWGAEVYLKMPRHKTKNSALRSITTILPGSGTPITLSSFTNVSAELKKCEIGFDIRQGILLAPETMLYARLGVAFNTINVSTTTTILNTQTQLINSQSKKVQGLRLGGGMEHEFMPRWTVRVDYVFTSYRKIMTSDSRGALGDGFARGNVAASISGSTRLNNHASMIGIAYHW